MDITASMRLKICQGLVVNVSMDMLIPWSMQNGIGGSRLTIRTIKNKSKRFEMFIIRQFQIQNIVLLLLSTARYIVRCIILSVSNCKTRRLPIDGSWDYLGSLCIVAGFSCSHGKEAPSGCQRRETSRYAHIDCRSSDYSTSRFFGLPWIQ